MFFRSLILLLLVSTTAAADTVYIRDTLYVPLRGGQSIEHRILHRGLKSGSELERLETNDETGYTRVRTKNGLEGWLQSQYLVDDPIASTQLVRTTVQLDDLEAQHQQTLLRLRDASESNDQMTATTTSLTAQNQTLSSELEKITMLAADVIAIEAKNTELSEERTNLLSEIEELGQRNESLLDDQAQEWFLRGAGTILIGLLFGFWIGRRIYHRRTESGWS